MDELLTDLELMGEWIASLEAPRYQLAEGICIVALVVEGASLVALMVVSDSRERIRRAHSVAEQATEV